MNIQTEKLVLIEWIARINDSAVLEKLKSIQSVYVESHEWWDELSQADKESINRGLKDIEEGRVYSHESAKKSYDNYL